MTKTFSFASVYFVEITLQEADSASREYTTVLPLPEKNVARYAN